MLKVPLIHKIFTVHKNTQQCSNVFHWFGFFIVYIYIYIYIYIIQILYQTIFVLLLSGYIIM